MAATISARVLVVDDDAGIRDVMAILLGARGYEVNTAKHGLDALSQMKRKKPAIVISDLNMPRMSGYEFLSVVRRRFPEIGVIAMSGAYTGYAGDGGINIPKCIIADTFYAKGQADSPKSLLDAVSQLLTTSATRAADHQQESVPAWVSRNEYDGSVLLTCAECMRSFSCDTRAEHFGRIRQSRCVYCDHLIRYVIDHSSGSFAWQDPTGVFIH